MARRKHPNLLLTRNIRYSASALLACALATPFSETALADESHNPDNLTGQAVSAPSNPPAEPSDRDLESQPVTDKANNGGTILRPGDGRWVLPETVTRAETRASLNLSWTRPSLGEKQQELQLGVVLTAESSEDGEEQGDNQPGPVKVWASVNGGAWQLLGESSIDDEHRITLIAGDFAKASEVTLRAYAIDSQGKVVLSDAHDVLAAMRDSDLGEAEEAADSPPVTEADEIESEDETEIVTEQQASKDESIAKAELKPGRFARYDGQPNFERRQKPGVAVVGGGSSGGGGGGTGGGFSGGSSGGGGGGGGGASPDNGSGPPASPSEGANDNDGASPPARPGAGGGNGTDQTGRSLRFDHTASGTSGRVIGSVIVLSNVDVVTWSSDQHVRVIYGTPLVSGMAAAPSRESEMTELTPHLGGSLFAGVPQGLHNIPTGFVVLGTSAGSIDLTIWSRADDPDTPNREILEWSATVRSNADPAVLFD